MATKYNTYFTCSPCLAEKLRMVGNDLAIDSKYIITESALCDLEVDESQHPQPESSSCDCCSNEYNLDELEITGAGYPLCEACHHVQFDCLTGSGQYGDMETCAYVGHELA